MSAIDFGFVRIDVGGLHLIGFQRGPAGDADVKLAEILCTASTAASRMALIVRVTLVSDWKFRSG